MDQVIEKYTIEDNVEEDHHTFIFKRDKHSDTNVSFNHAGQLQCDCKGFMQYHITCVHILVILEHITLNNVQEVVPIEALVDIKRFYIKSNCK